MILYSSQIKVLKPASFNQYIKYFEKLKENNECLYYCLSFISWEVLKNLWMNREIIASSAFWIGSFLGRWDWWRNWKSVSCINIKPLYQILQKRIYTACCMTKLPLVLYCTSNTAITPTFTKSFESLHFEQYLNNICNSILPVVVISSI